MMFYFCSNAKSRPAPAMLGASCGPMPSANTVAGALQLPARHDRSPRQHWTSGGAMPAGNLLYWAVVALVIALVAAALGFGGIAGTASGIAQILFWVFLVVFVVVLVMNFFGRRGPTA
ncbi:DUF1328 family protein [Falsiroseomonas oryzae]